jgi:hypothetical protein
MRKLVKLLMLAAAIYVFSVSHMTASAQTGGDQPTDTIDASTSAHWLFTLSLGQAFSSNINQDETYVKSYGIIPGFGVSYRSSAKHPGFKFNYEVGLHRYTQTDRWNRTSHLLETSFERRLFKNWAAETEAVVSLNGTSEDRELADHYVIREEIKYRINKQNRLKVYGAYRVKRYHDDPGRNAIDPFIGARYQLLARNRSWTVGSRYDKNRPINPRGRYIRRIYSGEFSTPLPNNYGSLALGARLQSKQYARLIRVDGVRVPRHDNKWIFSAFWDRKISENIQTGCFYLFERQFSNQADKRFVDHELGFYLRYQWWR